MRMIKGDPKREKKYIKMRERQEIEGGRKYFKKMTERVENGEERPKKREKI